LTEVDSETTVSLASFPGRSHLQYLIACSMQIRRGNAWEISSRAVTSGRQKVDTLPLLRASNLTSMSPRNFLAIRNIDAMALAQKRSRWAEPRPRPAGRGRGSAHLLER